jgi:hypothetical protein
MKLTRSIFLALALIIPAASTVARADDKAPAAAEGEKAPADAKKAKKSKAKDKAAKEGEKKEGAEAAPAAEKPAK